MYLTAQIFADKSSVTENSCSFTTFPCWQNMCIIWVMCFVKIKKKKKNKGKKKKHNGVYAGGMGMKMVIKEVSQN